MAEQDNQSYYEGTYGSRLSTDTETHRTASRGMSTNSLAPGAAPPMPADSDVVSSISVDQSRHTESERGPQTQGNAADTLSEALGSYYEYYEPDPEAEELGAAGGRSSEDRTAYKGASSCRSQSEDGSLLSGSGGARSAVSRGTSIGPSVSEPGRAALLRARAGTSQDQQGLGLAAAGQEPSEYYSEYEYYSDYYAQHAANQTATEEYPLVEVEVRLNKPMGVIFEALQPEEEGGIRVVQLMKGSNASELLKLHDVLVALNGQPARHLPVAQPGAERGGPRRRPASAAAPRPAPRACAAWKA